MELDHNYKKLEEFCANLDQEKADKAATDKKEALDRASREEVAMRNAEAAMQAARAKQAAPKAPPTIDQMGHARDIASAKNSQLMMRLFTENNPEYDRLCAVLRQDRYDRERSQNLRARQ